MATPQKLGGVLSPLQHSQPWILSPTVSGTFPELLTCLSPTLSLKVLGPPKVSTLSPPQYFFSSLPLEMGDPSNLQKQSWSYKSPYGEDRQSKSRTQHDPGRHIEFP